MAGLDKATMKNAASLKKTGKSVKVLKAMDQKLEEDDNLSSEKDLKTKYQTESINGLTHLISFQAATKTANKNHIFNGVGRKNSKTLTKWEKRNGFLALCFEKEIKIVQNGFMFLGYTTIEDEPIPFLAEIVNLSADPLTMRKTELIYNIGSVVVDKITYNLHEKWVYQPETKNYLVTRELNLNNESKPLKEDNEYYREEELDFIQGEVFYTLWDFSSEIKNVKTLMKDRGTFLYYLLEKFEYLSPKIFNKTQISGMTIEQARKLMKEETLINLEERAAQFQNAITVFNPTLPNQVIESTINFLEEQIFTLSLSSKPTDSGKQAQTNDLEQKLKNEMANNFAEYRINVRENQLTKYFKLIAQELGIEAEELEVEIESSSIQETTLQTPQDQAKTKLLSNPFSKKPQSTNGGA